MIVYAATKKEFLHHAFSEDVHDIVLKKIQDKGRNVSKSEVAAWKESLLFMAKVLNDEDIPDDAGVGIEYGIPQSMKRIDFIVSGANEERKGALIIVELKRWSEAEKTEKDGVVIARFGKAKQETSHPSYQAWSYATLLGGFNEAVYTQGLALRPCAYLHNCDDTVDLKDPFYQHYYERAPLFLKGEGERSKLRNFIKQYVKRGDQAKAIYEIENGRIRPSKTLVDSLVGMLKGNEEFVLIDDQKVVFENALAIGRKADAHRKRVMIIEGGPGTGKSVVAINLLVALSKLGLVCRYVSKNAAPRTVYESKLTGVRRKTEIANMFSGSGVFTEGESNAFDVLIVDEAHRLNEKSGLYGNLGEHQVKEIISSSKSVVFFVDEDQRVTLKDIGTVAEIERWAGEFDADVSKGVLASQFRCGGSDGYLAWLDNTLQVRPTANDALDRDSFDFRVVDSASQLRDLIVERNRINNKARLVAGYCWNWVSKKNREQYDIVLEGEEFRARWNLASDGSLWIVAPNSVEEVGCVHTSQGLEVDYVGVIVGPDLIVRGGRVVTVASKRARTDKSLSGIKKMAEVDPDGAQAVADRIIKNTYRTLMTRGLKGCYVFCTDAETRDYLKARLAVSENRAAEVLPFKRLPRKEVRPYVNAVPIVDLAIAAGGLSQSNDADRDDWAVLPETLRPREGWFVARVVGASMNRRIPDGAWCVFRRGVAGDRSGRIVVAQHREIKDRDTGASYTIKEYQSRKAYSEDSFEHLEIRLKPDSTDKSYQDIVIDSRRAQELEIVAELVEVLGGAKH